jgi:hypothetical protein
LILLKLLRKLMKLVHLSSMVSSKAKGRRPFASSARVVVLGLGFGWPKLN